MTYEEAYSKLRVPGQEHLLRFFSELDKPGQHSLLSQIDETDLSYLDAFKAKAEAARRGVITPITAMRLPEIQSQEAAFRRTGIENAARGRLAAVLLAGGAGTRLGIPGPKGTCDIGITRPVYIFQRLIENLLDSVREIGTALHLFIMTSRANDAATRAFFKEHNFFGYDPAYIHFFVQEMAPAVDDCGKILLSSPSSIASSPNGNGGWFKSLAAAGYLDFMKEQGIEWLNVFAVDNVLQRICDPVFFGAVLKSGLPAGAKVIPKNSPEEKVGVMCLEDGRPSVVEYYELNDEMRTQRTEDGSYAYFYGVILNYLFRAADLEKVMNESMPIHFAHKAVPYVSESGEQIRPSAPNAWKFEFFIFDILHELSGCLPFEVLREKEFAPIKNPTGTDSVESARELLKANGIAL